MKLYTFLDYSKKIFWTTPKIFIVYNKNMSDFKIIISPSKSFNKNVKALKLGRRPKYLTKAKNIFEYIKKLSLEETKKIYKLSDKKS